MNGVDLLGQSLVDWLTTYGYWVLIPIMLFEGTTTGFIAGALSSLGVFNPFLVIISYIVSRIIADTIIFYSAWHGVSYLRRFPLARRIAEKVGEKEDGSQSELAQFLERNFFESLFLAKVLPSPMLDSALLLSAGILKIRPKRVYTAIVFGQIIWSTMIVGLGYFFGDTITNPERVVNVIGFSLGAFIVLYVLISKYGKIYFAGKNRLGQLLKK